MCVIKWLVTFHVYAIVCKPISSIVNFHPVWALFPFLLHNIYLYLSLCDNWKALCSNNNEIFSVNIVSGFLLIFFLGVYDAINVEKVTWLGTSKIPDGGKLTIYTSKELQKLVYNLPRDILLLMRSIWYCWVAHTC